VLLEERYDELGVVAFADVSFIKLELASFRLEFNIIFFI